MPRRNALMVSHAATMLRLNRRQSGDVDLFIKDPQFLSYVNPRGSAMLSEAKIVERPSVIQLKAECRRRPDVAGHVGRASCIRPQLRDEA
jgi:hypothetical protein